MMHRDIFQTVRASKVHNWEEANVVGKGVLSLLCKKLA